MSTTKSVFTYKIILLNILIYFFEVRNSAHGCDFQITLGLSKGCLRGEATVDHWFRKSFEIMYRHRICCIVAIKRKYFLWSHFCANLYYFRSNYLIDSVECVFRNNTIVSHCNHQCTAYIHARRGSHLLTSSTVDTRDIWYVLLLNDGGMVLSVLVELALLKKRWDSYMRCIHTIKSKSNSYRKFAIILVCYNDYICIGRKIIIF